MRIFNNCLEMIKEVERDLFEMGIKYQSATVQDFDASKDKAFETLELNGYAYKLTSMDQLDEMLDYMKISKLWVEAEHIERLDPGFENPGKAWKLYRVWEQYLHDGIFQYTYSERLREQLAYVIRELRRNSNTRQAVLTIYDRYQDMMNWGGKARVPCSLSYQFIIRNRKLRLIYSMRSCDFLKHFAADVALALLLQGEIAKELKLNPGTFTHFLGSLHAFHGDMKDRGIY